MLYRAEIGCPLGDLGRVLRVQKTPLGAMAGNPGSPEEKAKLIRGEPQPVRVCQPVGELLPGPGAVLLG